MVTLQSDLVCRYCGLAPQSHPDGIPSLITGSLKTQLLQIVGGVQYMRDTGRLDDHLQFVPEYLHATFSDTLDFILYCMDNYQNRRNIGLCSVFAYNFLFLDKFITNHFYPRKFMSERDVLSLRAAAMRTFTIIVSKYQTESAQSSFVSTLETNSAQVAAEDQSSVGDFVPPDNAATISRTSQKEAQPGLEEPEVVEGISDAICSEQGEYADSGYASTPLSRGSSSWSLSSEDPLRDPSTEGSYLQGDSPTLLCMPAPDKAAHAMGQYFESTNSHNELYKQFVRGTSTRWLDSVGEPPPVDCDHYR